MSIKTAKFIVSPLRGMDQRWDTRPNQAFTIENMTWSDQDSWRTSQGYRRIVSDYEETTTSVVGEETVTIPTGNTVNIYDSESVPNSIYWFCQHGNSLQWIIYEDRAGRILHFNGSKAPSNPRTIIQYADGNAFDGTTKFRKATQSEEVSHTDFAMYGSNLYMVNGQDAPLVFDGKKCTRAGFTGKPNSPTAYVTEKTEIRETFVSGVGYENSDNAFKYVVTFVNERGQESQMSPESTKISFDTTVTGESGQTAGEYRQFVAVNIPTGPIGTVARRIYRTLNMINFIEGSSVVTLPKENLFGKEFYFVDEIQDNVTTIYVDGASDFDVGSLSLPSDFGEFPKNSTHIAVFKNTMFVADDMTSDIRYSRPLNPEVFPPDNVFSFSDKQTSLITGLYPTRDSLVVFKQRGIYLIKGDPVSGFFGQTLTTDIGCISAATIKEVPGVGLVFLAHDGVYVLDGTLAASSSQTKFVKLSQGLRDIFNRVNFEFAERFRSVVYHRDREYWLSVCLDDKRVPDTILKFSYEIGAWSIYDKMETAGMIEVQDHRGYLLSVGPSADFSTGARGIYIYGSTNQKGELGTVESVYETVNIPFNSVYENFSPARVQARVVGYGNTLNLSVFTNREPATVATTASGTQKRALEDNLFPLYGSVSTNAGVVYKEHRPVIVRMDFSTMQKGPINELKLRFTCSDEMEIVSYNLEGRIGGSRDVINLTDKFGGSLTR
tara:strand:+ start:13607 stop:15766 length:2160 start_codon:yes stop_codon:yes gene_type:complete